MFNNFFAAIQPFLVPLDISKFHEEQLYSWQSKENMQAENWNV